jgi:mRNA deadenylase 3'-5' endonuclease subunit Ccr4
VWEVREKKIMTELHSYQPDLISLQEVSSLMLETMLPQLETMGFVVLYPEGEHGMTEASDLESGSYHAHFPVLAVQKDRLEILDWGVIKLDTLATSLINPDQSASHRLLLERYEEIGAEGALSVYARLNHIPESEQLLVAAVHLHHDPSEPHIKVLQAQSLVGQLLSKKSSETPLILAGDFNSVARKHTSDIFDEIEDGGHLVSGVYEALTTGRLRPSHPDHPSQREPGLLQANEPASQNLQGQCLVL